MKQVLQTPGNGKVWVSDVPAPVVSEGLVLVQVAASLVSAGTERAALEFGRQSLLAKARSRPDLVQRVREKARRDGILSAFQAARHRLDMPSSLGYACSGTVIGIGAGVTGVQVGDRVACAGAGYAVHAEFVRVPPALVVKLPPQVDFESGAFVTLGAIALHGTRLAPLAIGETTAVIGLGLVGLLTTQIARAAGCRVLGIDPNPVRCSLALRLGAEGAAATEAEFRVLVATQTEGLGVDHVIVAAGSKDSKAMTLAGEVARDRGSVIVVGDVGMDTPRRLFYQKELSLRVSRSYGPGRYDAAYEEEGHDYPIGYVRWTERRNMEAVAGLLAGGQITVEPLITHRYAIQSAADAYDMITHPRGQQHLGVIITYQAQADASTLVPLRDRAVARTRDGMRVGMVGAGAFATGTLIPALLKQSVIALIGVCTSSGASGQRVGAKFGFQYCTTDPQRIVDDPEVDTVVIATPHHLHASQVSGALDAGKRVFVEKPLALSESELRAVARRLVTAHEPGSAMLPSDAMLMVGYNRRFAPMALRLKEFFGGSSDPLLMRYRVNAGALPSGHWTANRRLGGGRVIGEVCHFVDLLTYLVGALPTFVYARSMGDAAGASENVIASLEFADGSLGEITYVTTGDTAFGKERLEVYGGGRSAVLDDFRRLELIANGRRKVQTSRQDKGHVAEWQAFAKGVTTGAPPIPYDELLTTSLATFRIEESGRTGQRTPIGLESFLASLSHASASHGSSEASAA